MFGSGLCRGASVHRLVIVRRGVGNIIFDGDDSEESLLLIFGDSRNTVGAGVCRGDVSNTSVHIAMRCASEWVYLDVVGDLTLLPFGPTGEDHTHHTTHNTPYTDTGEDHHIPYHTQNTPYTQHTIH